MSKTATVTIKFDPAPLVNALVLFAWQFERAVAGWSTRTERARETSRLRIDRKYEVKARLDVQLVTGSDGVCRVRTRRLGGWTHG